MLEVIKNGDVTLLNGKIAVLGYGSQGHAHALNLKDSGVDVMVGLREGSKSWQEAKDAGLKVGTVPEAVKDAQVVAFLIPDGPQAQVYKKEVAPNLAPGAALLFAHGFSVHYGRIKPPRGHDVIMVAPKGPGHILRRMFEDGTGIPSLVAVAQDASGNARELALAWAAGIGSGRVGIIETTFKDETETDLFGEQAVLCGGVSALVKAGFETLVEAGYQPEVAYFECLHELKLIVDLMYRGGLRYMRYSISDTAEYGDYVSGPRVIDAHVKETMGKLLEEIQNGTFARKWIEENETGRKSFSAQRAKERDLTIEKVGEKLRAMMPFLDPVTVEPQE